MATRVATAITPLSIPTQPWETDAACAHNPYWTHATISQQKAFCGTCPVIDQCAALGLQVIQVLDGHVAETSHDMVYGGKTIPELMGRQCRHIYRDWPAVCEQIEQMLRDGHDRFAIAQEIGYKRPTELNQMLRRNGHHEVATRLAAA